MKPHVTLVGAGPGDPDLISVKGLRAIQQANVLLYDALVHPTLLEHAPPKARKLYVGKRAGKHHLRQEEINERIVHYALSEGHVVRLKGGDPFVFGRGQEEIRYAESFNIATTVIPGISSATSLPGLQGIPLTHRSLSQGFWVLTATNAAYEVARDIELAVQSSATLVILMGMRKLAHIADSLLALGKAQIPIAIIQNGSLPDERIATGFAYNICQVAEKAQMGTPAIIVIGDVVRFSKTFRKESIEKQHSEYKFTA